jgi:hypothetical protein
MNDTIREFIIKDFIARLAVITIANDYATDIGTHVIRARKKLDPAELSAVVIWPGTETPVYTYGKRSCTMKMKVEGIVEFGEEDPSVIAEKILGDLKKCFLAPENLLTSPHSGWSRSPDYIDSIIYTGGGTEDYPDDGQISVGAFATFDVTYTENINDPCSQ